jgi:cell division protein FtsI (penicillin-binding protein 3)
MLKTRFTALMLSCFLIAFCIVLRAAYIQIFPNPKLEAMARRQYLSRSLIRPQRGALLDRNGDPLVVNIETSSLAANPNSLINKRALARVLARCTDGSFSRIFHKLSENREFTWIKRHLSESELKRLKKARVIDSDGDLVEGLFLVKESDRVYPHGPLAAHVVGSVNVDVEGVEGIELWLNDRLRGRVASVQAIKDALGRPTFIDAIAAKSVQDGEAVTLTLDGALQYEVERHLKTAVQKASAQGGSVIVMNAESGEILAMANEPSFNPNDNAAPADRRRNRAVTDGYEPGSTLKAMLAASAISHGWKMSDEVWGERGSFVVQKHKISEAEAREKFEWVNLKKMLKVSSNIAAAKVALKLGVEKYLRTLHLFGFGSKTGLGFPGEISGRIPKKKDWQPLTLANVGFGQGILVTPLQMVRAYGAILNGGLLVQPSLLKSSGLVAAAEPPVRIFSQRVSDEMIDALEGVTQEGGTGVKAALPGFRVAGKTGTAQMVDPETGTYSREKYIASFIGFPIGVQPKIVIFTSIIEPKGVYYASETAAPLFKEVLASVANRCSLPGNLPVSPVLARGEIITDVVQMHQAAPEEQSGAQVQDAPVSDDLGPGPVPLDVIPSFQGLTPREILRRFKGRHLQWEILGSGVVKTQSPMPGSPLVEGGVIRLILAEP